MANEQTANSQPQVADGGTGVAPLPTAQADRGVNTRPVAIGSLGGTGSSANLPALVNQEKLPIEAMTDVPVTLVFEVGRTAINIQQLMEMRKGAHIELRHVSVDTIDIRVSDQVIARGEAIALQQWYGIRFGEVEIPPGMELSKL